jgi:hypothetical protein
MPSITLTLPAETEQKLRVKAGTAGLTPETYLRQLVERDVANGMHADPDPGERMFDEILAPVREEALNDPMSDEDVAALVKGVRQAARRDK